MSRLTGVQIQTWGRGHGWKDEEYWKSTRTVWYGWSGISQDRCKRANRAPCRCKGNAGNSSADGGAADK